MLGWLAGSGRGQYTGFADESKVADAPETPGPVFAFRAFRSALLGTPAPDAEAEEDLTVPIKQLKTGRYRGSANLSKKVEKPTSELPQLSIPKPEDGPQPMASPTKSILLTPGTAATRRKTVSFGEGVVDNERKKTGVEPDGDKDASTGNDTAQWNGHESDGPRKHRSKLTQSLLDAREKKTKDDDELFDIIPRKSTTKFKHPLSASALDETVTTEKDKCDHDETVNLEEPRSQSGIYWKSEFEDYRAKTNDQIKKLIQYRSTAKSYASKKEAEVLRLSEELKQKEEKVLGMERRVSEMAAGMIGSARPDYSSDKDMVKELSRKTALALQLKQDVDSMRKELERLENSRRHDNQRNDENEMGENVKRRESKPAGGEIQELESHQSEMEKLRGLVESSERKATDFEKENKMLKQSLARFKESMSKYEERRKTNESRLKRREQRLEGRLQDYRARLQNATQEHREAEKEQKKSFTVEKQRMQETIDSLRGKVSALEQRTQTLEHVQNEFVRSHGQAGRTASAKTGRRPLTESVESDGAMRTTGTSQSPKKQSSMLFHDSPSGRKAAGASNTALDSPAAPLRSREDSFPDSLIDFSDNEEPLMRFDESTPRPKANTASSRSNRYSAPVVLSTEHETVERDVSLSPEKRKLKKPSIPVRDIHSPRPSMVYMQPSPPKQRAQRRFKRPYSTTSLVPSSLNRQLTPPADEPSLASIKRDALPPDRAAAAVERLARKREERKAAAIEAKENNIWAP